PQGVGALLARPLVGKLTDRFRDVRPILFVCAALACIGTVPYLFVDQHVNEVLLGVSLLVRGAGLGGLIIPLNASAYQELSKDAVPGATSAINIVLRVGASFGTAILAVILQHELTSHAASTDGQLTAFGNTFFWTLILTAAAL